MVIDKVGREQSCGVSVGVVQKMGDTDTGLNRRFLQNKVIKILLFRRVISRRLHISEFKYAPQIGLFR